MKLRDFYNLVVDLGIKHDPRGVKCVREQLNKVNERYESLSKDQKKFFDIESLKNPYNDTRVLNGNMNDNVKNIMLGIDIDTSELLLADRLKERGEKIDLVVSHHPAGRAYANFYEVMSMQADILNKTGIPINVAEHLTAGRMKEVARRVSSANHTKGVDAAKLLNLPFMCAHTPSDNFVATYLSKLFDKKRPQTLGDIMNILSRIPEYREARVLNRPPNILVGSKDNRAGKIFVDMTGGTEGAKEIFDKMEVAGIGTVVCMHLSEEHFKKVKDCHINVIVAGHIASDVLGLNLLLDEASKKKSIKVVPCSGFTRHKRSEI